MKPKLRAVRADATTINGQSFIVLRDPLRLSDKTVALPQALAPLLALCDGSRDEAGLRAALQVRSGIYLSPDRLADILNRLDEALLLDNASYRLACVRALNTYRSAPCRAPALAGQAYPADPGELAALLDGLLAAAPRSSISLVARGMISPHIDYERGGAIYAEVWSRVAASARRAEVAVILGTDHQSDQARLTLTRQDYATPFGVLPTDTAVVDATAQALGIGEAFAEELHHRSEHSVELAAVWLHHVRRGRLVRLVPILCGSFERYVAGLENPADDATLEHAIAVLRQALAGRRALVVAAGDLAHCGPAFGDAPIGPALRALGSQTDVDLIAAIQRGDADGFFARIKADGDRRHICGLGPIYLALRLLAPLRGEPAGYAQVAADPQGHSFVSVCGVALL